MELAGDRCISVTRLFTKVKFAVVSFSPLFLYEQMHSFAIQSLECSIVRLCVDEIYVEFQQSFENDVLHCVCVTRGEIMKTG